MQLDILGAQWISGEPYAYEPEQTYYDECRRNHVVRASFELACVPKCAALTIAVMGYARVRINGTKVDESELLGWWTNYSKRVYSYEVEVGSLLVTGQNSIEVELGTVFQSLAAQAFWQIQSSRAPGRGWHAACAGCACRK